MYLPGKVVMPVIMPISGWIMLFAVETKPESKTVPTMNGVTTTVTFKVNVLNYSAERVVPNQMPVRSFKTPKLELLVLFTKKKANPYVMIILTYKLLK